MTSRTWSHSSAKAELWDDGRTGKVLRPSHGRWKVILGFSHDFGKEVIAEGVETAGQLNLCMTRIAKMSSEFIRSYVCRSHRTTLERRHNHSVKDWLCHGAVPPTDGACAYPLDPGIALRGSQTIYPMDRAHCMILTNLEYAKDPSIGPLEKRTFARNYRQSLTRIDAFIRTRELTAQEVAQINFIIKKRARRYIGGGRRSGCTRKGL